MSVQLAFGSVEVTGPRLEDLEGLLCGSGEVVRRPNGAPATKPAARVSVVVHEDWRATALLAGLETLDLAGDTGPAEGGGRSVRTPFSDRLVDLASRWTRGAMTLPPEDLMLDGGRLRCWLLAAGQPVPGRLDAWDLGLPDQEAGWPRIGAALAAAGVPGALVGPRRRAAAGEDDAGPGARAVYRVLGVRRLRRLRELVGPPPAEAPRLAWPTG
jgi:hypothetical protein